jgi:hypothetical protein
MSHPKGKTTTARGPAYKTRNNWTTEKITQELQNEGYLITSRRMK